MIEKQRLDNYLVKTGSFNSITSADAAIMEGHILIDGKPVTKPGFQISSQKVEIIPFDKYVSRGAYKLKKAIDVFKIDVKGKKTLDIGAGSGGFTEVLLEAGAEEVVAIDVGYGQFDWKLRNDPRVKLFERTNVRYLKPDEIGELADLAVIDLSFISVLKVIDNLKRMMKDEADIILLIKPQFEVFKDQVPKGGVITDSKEHLKVLENLSIAMGKNNIGLQRLDFSPIKGAKGNIEFLGHFTIGRQGKKIAFNDVVCEASKEL